MVTRSHAERLQLAAHPEQRESSNSSSRVRSTQELEVTVADEQQEMEMCVSPSAKGSEQSG